MGTQLYSISSSLHQDWADLCHTNGLVWIDILMFFFNFCIYQSQPKGKTSENGSFVTCYVKYYNIYVVVKSKWTVKYKVNNIPLFLVASKEN